MADARPHDVADVRRAFAARGIDVRIPEGGVALGWSGEGPTGYKAFLTGEGLGYVVVFYAEASAAAWESALARRASPQWFHARRANVVVVAPAEDAEIMRAGLTELP